MIASVILFGSYLAFEFDVYSDSKDASPRKSRATCCGCLLSARL